MAVPQLITAGIIAHYLNERLERVNKVLANRRHIKPIARAGTLRIYLPEAIAQVRYELNALDARRRHAEAVPA